MVGAGLCFSGTLWGGGGVAVKEVWGCRHLALPQPDCALVPASWFPSGSKHLQAKRVCVHSHVWKAHRYLHRNTHEGVYPTPPHVGRCI